MTSNYFFFIKLSSLVFIGLLVFSSLLDYHNSPEFELNTFKTSSGWGYDISVNTKTFIHQEIIPAANGNQAFSDELDAKKTGSLVINKLKSGKQPIIALYELDSLNIAYKK